MWAKWVMRLLADVYIVGGVVSLFAQSFKALLR